MILNQKKVSFNPSNESVAKIIAKNKTVKGGK